METRGQLVLVSLATKTLEQIVRLVLSSTLLPVVSCALESSDTVDTLPVFLGGGGQTVEVGLKMFH